MSHPREPAGYGPPRYGSRRPAGSDPRIRISDADRKEMTDTLARHYADGRLDTAEFDERVGRAMAAKTRGDLGGLLDDLPRLDEPAPPSPRRRPSVVRILLAFVLVAVAGAMIAASAHAHVPWLLLIFVGWFVWHRTGHRHYRRARWY